MTMCKFLLSCLYRLTVQGPTVNTGRFHDLLLANAEWKHTWKYNIWNMGNNTYYGTWSIHNTPRHHLPLWSSHTGNLLWYFCWFGCLLLLYFLLSRLKRPLCNIWGEREAYQFLTEPTQLLQRLASIGNLLEVKENWKVMKPKNLWGINEGKHLEKSHVSIDSTDIFLSTYHVSGIMLG